MYNIIISSGPGLTVPGYYLNGIICMFCNIRVINTNIASNRSHETKLNLYIRYMIPSIIQSDQFFQSGLLRSFTPISRVASATVLGYRDILCVFAILQSQIQNIRTNSLRLVYLNKCHKRFRQMRLLRA